MKRHYIKRHIKKSLSFILTLAVSINTIYFNSHAEIATPSQIISDFQTETATSSQIQDDKSYEFDNDDNNPNSDMDEYIEENFRTIPQYLLEDDIEFINPNQKVVTEVVAGAAIIAAILASLGYAVTQIQANNIYLDMQSSMRNDSDGVYSNAGVDTTASMQALYAVMHGDFKNGDTVTIDANTYDACRVYAQQRLAWGQETATTGAFNHNIGINVMSASMPLTWSYQPEGYNYEDYETVSTPRFVSEPYYYWSTPKEPIPGVSLDVNGRTCFSCYAEDGINPFSGINIILVSSTKTVNDGGVNVTYPCMRTQLISTQKITSSKTFFVRYEEYFTSGKIGYVRSNEYKGAGIVSRKINDNYYTTNTISWSPESVYGQDWCKLSGLSLNYTSYTFANSLPVYTEEEYNTYFSANSVGFDLSGKQYGDYVSGQKTFDTTNGLDITYADDIASKLGGYASGVDADDKAFEDYIKSIITNSTNGFVAKDFNYNQLKYILNALATSFSVSIKDTIIDSFIDDYYGDYIGGSSAEKYEESDEIINKFVVINGGGNPDNNNDKNKYKVLIRLAEAFATFLIVSGLLSGDSSDYVSTGPVTENIDIVDNSNIPTEPDNPNDSDNKSILGFLKSILESILNLPNLINEKLPNALAQVLPNAFLQVFLNPLSIIETAINLLPKNITDLLPVAIFDLFKNPLSIIQNLISKLPNSMIDVFLNPLKAIQNVIELLPNELIEGFALPDLFNGITTLVGNLPNAIAEALNLNGLFNNLQTWLGDIPSNLLNILNAIKALPESFTNESNESNKNDENEEDSFSNFFKFVFSMLYIILLLMMIFFNCLRLIVAIFNIPSSTLLFNDKVLMGLQFTKDLQLPLLGVSLYSLLTGLAFFMCVMSIIGLLKRKIEKLHE